MNRNAAQLMALGFVLVLAAAPLVRLLVQSRTQLDLGLVALEQGDRGRAIEHLRRAMRGRFPANPAPARASAALERIAADCERTAELDCALAAWRGLSGSRAAVRWLGSGSDLERDRANAQIARLMATHGRVPMDSGLDEPALRDAHLASLTAGEAVPRPFGAGLLLLGFACWLLGLVWLSRRGFDRAGRWLGGPGRAPGALTLAGLLAFLLGALLA